MIEVSDYRQSTSACGPTWKLDWCRCRT